MTTLVSNRLALSNPISEEVQKEFLANCCRIVYHIEMTDDIVIIRDKFSNWDDLVRFIDKSPELFEHALGVSEFKIWTETDDFSVSI